MTTAPGTDPLVRILHVEDDADIRLIVEMALALDPALSVRSAESGEAALAMLAGEAGEWMPDLLLLDVMMPALDGTGLLERIRALPRLGPVPAVFMTARCGAGDQARYRAAGALDIIVKPFDPMTLAERLRSALTRAE